MQPNGHQVEAETTDRAPGDPDVTDLLGVLGRHRWSILAILVVAALVGYGFGSRSPVERRADTRLLLVDAPEQSSVVPASSPLPLEERQSAVASRVESQETLAEVTEALDLAPGDIKDISATAAEGQSFVTITVSTVDGVDTAAITDEVAASVLVQQQEAASARADALAEQLREAANDVNGQIEAIDVQLTDLAKQIAALELEVERTMGLEAGIEPRAQLSLRSDRAAGLRATRVALLTTQADFRRDAREAEVAGAISLGGVEVYEPAGSVSVGRAMPPAQLAVLMASIALVAVVCAAYFVAYRREAPEATTIFIDQPRRARRIIGRDARRHDHERGGEQDAASDADRA